MSKRRLTIPNGHSNSYVRKQNIKTITNKQQYMKDKKNEHKFKFQNYTLRMFHKVGSVYKKSLSRVCCIATEKNIPVTVLSYIVLLLVSKKVLGSI